MVKMALFIICQQCRFSVNFIHSILSHPKISLKAVNQPRVSSTKGNMNEGQLLHQMPIGSCFTKLLKGM